MLGAWLEEPTADTLYATILFLAIGVILIWISRRMNTSKVIKEGLNFKYGLSYLGCAMCGVNLLDAVALYLFVTAVTFFVALFEGKLAVFNELFGAIYFIMTVAVCLTYPIFYHPLLGRLMDMVVILKDLKSKFKIAYFSYARNVGLLMKFEDGSIALVTIPPFSEEAPFTPVAILDEKLKKRDEEFLDASVIILKPYDGTKHFSIFSAIEWHLQPRMRRIDKVELKEISVKSRIFRCYRTKGEVDIPHPEKKGYRLKMVADVIYTNISRKVIKRGDKNPKYLARVLSLLISEMLNSYDF